MITDKKTYKQYVSLDLKAYELDKVGFIGFWKTDQLRFQLRLRKIEYLHNVKQKHPIFRLYLFVLELLNHRLSVKLGFSIPKNVFGPGLCIVHYGTIVVSSKASVGSFCRIHPSTSIGDYNGAPKLGDYVYIGPGAKIFGDIKIGNGVAIGANSVVNKDVEENVTIAGIPAKKISNKNSMASGIYPEKIKRDVRL